MKCLHERPLVLSEVLKIAILHCIQIMNAYDATVKLDVNFFHDVKFPFQTFQDGVFHSTRRLSI